MSKFRETLVSNCEKSFTIKCLSEHTRIDKRAFDEFRDLIIEFGNDYGSCMVSLGKTKVLAQTSCEIQQPKTSRPNEGILNINIEMNPLGAPHFEPGRQTEMSVQLNRLIEKCIKDSKAVDLESLCIKMDEKVWSFRVDVNVLNHEGNLVDCASIAALTSLADFRRPDVTCDGEEFIIHNFNQRDPIPTVIHHYPICVTYALLDRGNYILADPTLLEEGVADAFLTVGMNSYRELCGLSLGGNVELSPETILDITRKVASRVSYVVDEIKQAVQKNNENRSVGKELGFHMIFEKFSHDKSTTEQLEECFNQWQPISKNKKKDKKTDVSVEGLNSSEDKIISKVPNSAVLVPKNYEEVMEVWGSSEDEDMDVVEIKKQNPVVSLLDSDSEEEKVVVLNANEKTKKWKKNR